MADGSHLEFIQKPVTFEPFEITAPNSVPRLPTNPKFRENLKFSDFLEMQDGGWQPSWIYIKAGNFRTIFETTKLNLVPRLPTKPEFKKTSKFSEFLEMQDGGWQPSWIYIKTGNFRTVRDNHTNFGIQTPYKTRIQEEFEIFRICRNARWRTAAILDLF